MVNCFGCKHEKTFIVMNGGRYHGVAQGCELDNTADGCTDRVDVHTPEQREAHRVAVMESKWRGRRGNPIGSLRKVSDYNSQTGKYDEYTEMVDESNY